MIGPPAINFNARNETARGFLLLGVFFMHALWFYTSPMTSWRDAPISFAILKLLAPQIAVYWLLTGMSLRGIGRKSFRAVLPQSLMLIFLAWVSESVGLIAQELFYGNNGTGIVLLKGLVKPILYGTGGCTVITWFFTTVAISRILVWVFEKSRVYFVVSWMVILGLILIATRLHWPDSLYEWPDWPMATLLMLVGMRFPKDWTVPAIIGLPGLVLSMVLIWFDAPGMWRHLPCLLCNVDFIPVPDVGLYGFLPAYIAAQLGLFAFLLWGAQVAPAMLLKLGRYFGRASLQFLLLHGWILVTVWSWMSHLLPVRGNFLVPLVLLVAVPAVHAFIFKFTENYLNQVLAFCFKSGRVVTDWIYGLFGVGERPPALERWLSPLKRL